MTALVAKNLSCDLAHGFAPRFAYSHSNKREKNHIMRRSYGDTAAAMEAGRKESHEADAQGGNPATGGFE
jgi:hypothetical protein